MSCDVLILRGAPGSGKTTVAKHLTDYFPLGVTVEVDQIRRMMHRVDWADDNLHARAITVAASTVRTFLAQGRFPIIFVDTLGFGRLEFAIAELGAASVDIYSLACKDIVLSIRLLRRFGGYRNARNARRFNAHILADADRYPVTDTTSFGGAAVAASIAAKAGARA